MFIKDKGFLFFFSDLNEGDFVGMTISTSLADLVGLSFEWASLWGG